MLIKEVKLIDNSSKDLSESIKDSAEISLLREISDKSLRELSNSEQIITIPDTNRAELLSEQYVVSLDNRDIVHTGNIVGFIGNDKASISITSRFANGETDLFIQYMLCRILQLNVTQFTHFSSNKGILNILPFLFPFYLKKALTQGIYKSYTQIQHNNSKPKGHIDIASHIKRNLLFNGSIAYSTRERIEDNHITQLIRHTIESLATDKIYKRILSIDRDTVNGINNIRNITPSFNHRDLLKILNVNRKPLVHPYFNCYTQLQKLCRLILEKRNGSYGNSSSKLNGILIDISWLWEEYLNEILKEICVVHPRNRVKKGAIYTANSVRIHPDLDFRKKNIWERYPDFYTGNCVLDAKYKFISKDTIDRNDVHQMISYLYLMDKRHGAFISPSNACINEYEDYVLNGKGGSLSILRMAIPQEYNSLTDFVNNINHSESNLLDFIKKSIDI